VLGGVVLWCWEVFVLSGCCFSCRANDSNLLPALESTRFMHPQTPHPTHLFSRSSSVGCPSTISRPYTSLPALLVMNSSVRRCAASSQCSASARSRLLRGTDVMSRQRVKAAARVVGGWRWERRPAAGWPSVVGSGSFVWCVAWMSWVKGRM